VPVDLWSENQASYQSDSLALGGAIIVCCFLPSFNVFFAREEFQSVTIINTFIGIFASVMISFSISYLMNGQRFSLVQLQTACLAGGISMASSHSMFVPPWAAAIIGGVTSIIVLLMHTLLLQPLFRNTLRLRDHRHALARHGIPGLLGAICSMIVIKAYNDKMVYGYKLDNSFWGIDHGEDQSLRQFYGWLITLGISVVSAILSGIVIQLFVEQVKPPKRPFIEFKYWVPLGTDYEGSSL